MWEVENIKIIKYVWVCVYALVNVRSKKGKEEIKFWNYMNECLMKIGRWSRIVLIGDMNGKVGNNVVEKWGMCEMNENGE